MLAAMRRLLGGRPASRDSETRHLYRASAQGELGLVRLLLADSADPNEYSPDGEGTPLCAAACHSDTEIVRELLDRGADPDLKEDEWFTPLRWAASNGHLETALLLLDRGADSTRADYDGHTPLAIAAGWAGKDVEAELVTRVGVLARARGDVLSDAEIVRTGKPSGDGTDVVCVEARFPDESSLGADLQTGHSEIAALLLARGDAA
jgi:ankyrin repeat protein